MLSHLHGFISDLMKATHWKNCLVFRNFLSMAEGSLLENEILEENLTK